MNKLNISVAETGYIRLSTRHATLPASLGDGSGCYTRKGEEDKEESVSATGWAYEKYLGAGEYLS